MLILFFHSVQNLRIVLKTLLFFFTMVLVFIALEKNTNAHYHFLEDDSENSKKSLLEELPFFKEFFSSSSIIGDIPEGFEQDVPFQNTENINYPKGMIPFISGLIIVYLPEIENAGMLARDIVHIATKEKIDPLYIAAIISVESRFSTKAKSRVGAMGLMQIMPNTAKEIIERKKIKLKQKNYTDPQINILLGVHYIKELERRYKNPYLALAAYNWGMGNIDKTKIGEKEIPTSVDNYASKVLTRTKRWNKHFSEANKGENLLFAGR